MDTKSKEDFCWVDTVSLLSAPHPLSRMRAQRTNARLTILSTVSRQQAKKEEDFLRSQLPDGAPPDPKDFAPDERTLQWASYAHGPYGPAAHHSHSGDAIPYDPRDPDKDAYAHGGRMMHPNDYGPRHHIYESPNFA